MEPKLRLYFWTPSNNSLVEFAARESAEEKIKLVGNEVYKITALPVGWQVEEERWSLMTCVEFVDVSIALILKK